MRTVRNQVLQGFGVLHTCVGHVLDLEEKVVLHVDAAVVNQVGFFVITFDFFDSELESIGQILEMCSDSNNHSRISFNIW